MGSRRVASAGVAVLLLATAFNLGSGTAASAPRPSVAAAAGPSVSAALAPTALSVTGSGWRAGQGVTLSLGGSRVTAVADSRGAVAADVPVPGRPECGQSLTLAARAGSTSARSPITWECGDVGARLQPDATGVRACLTDAASGRVLRVPGPAGRPVLGLLGRVASARDLRPRAAELASSGEACAVATLPAASGSAAPAAAGAELTSWTAYLDANGDGHFADTEAVGSTSREAPRSPRSRAAGGTSVSLPGALPRAAIPPDPPGVISIEPSCHFTGPTSQKFLSVTYSGSYPDLPTVPMSDYPYYFLTVFVRPSDGGSQRSAGVRLGKTVPSLRQYDFQRILLNTLPAPAPGTLPLGDYSVTVERVDGIQGPKLDRGASAPAGRFALPRDERGSGLIATAVSNTVPFHVPCATLSVTPGQFAAGGPRTLRLLGDGYQPLQPVALSVDGLSAGSATATDAGTLDTTITVRDVGCFVHSVRAQDPRGARGDATFRVTCPSLVLTPTTVPDTQTPVDVTATLSGFDPSSRSQPRVVRVTLAGVVVDAVTNADGSVTAVLQGVDAPCGAPVTATAVEQIPEVDPPPQSSANFVVTCPDAPVVTATPAVFAAAPGTRAIGVVVDGLRPDVRVDVTLTPTGGGTPVASTLVTAPRDAKPPGRATGTLVTTGLPCGSYVLTATPRREGNPPGSTVITITCPVVTVSKPIVDEDELPLTEVVRGSGFDPLVPVHVRAPASSSPRVDVTTDDEGSFTLRLPLRPGAACGPGMVIGAEDIPEEGPVAASAALTIRCAGPAQLRVDPSSVTFTPGRRTVDVTGVGFAAGPGKDVQLFLDGVALEPVGGSAQRSTPHPVDASGGFAFDVALRSVEAGPHTLVAVQPRAGDLDNPSCRGAVLGCGTPYRTVSTLISVRTLRVVAEPTRADRDDPPSDVTLRGSGADPGVAVELTLPGGVRATAQSLADGTFVTTVPDRSLACGTAQAVVATESLPTSIADPAPSATTTLDVGCPDPPIVTVLPDRVATMPGTRGLQVLGRGFRPGVAVQLKTDDVDRGRPVVVTVTTDATGRLRAVVPTTNPACRPHSLSAVPSRGFSASAGYLVTCPTLVADPQRVVRGQDRPARVVGTGWDGGVLVGLRAGGDAADRAVPPTGADGVLVADVPLEDVTCGPVRVRAEERVDLRQPPAAGAGLDLACLTLTVQPGVVRVGSVAQVRATGFTPGAMLDLAWLLEDGQQVPVARRRAGSDGVLAFPTLLLAHDAVGPRRLLARSLADGGIDTPTLVVFGSTQPGRQNTLVVGRRGLLARR